MCRLSRYGQVRGRGTFRSRAPTYSWQGSGRGRLGPVVLLEGHGNHLWVSVIRRTRFAEKHRESMKADERQKPSSEDIAGLFRRSRKPPNLPSHGRGRCSTLLPDFYRTLRKTMVRRGIKQHGLATKHQLEAISYHLTAWHGMAASVS